MRFWLHFGMITLCGVMAVWAYTMSSKTRAAENEVARLKGEILKEQERLAVLKAEWAYLNRPERLRRLVKLNDDRLKLVPINAESYGSIVSIPMMSSVQIADLPNIDEGLLEQTVVKLERIVAGAE